MSYQREQLLAYLAGELPEREASKLRLQLADDVHLRARLERLQNLQEALQGARPDSFGPYFSERLVKRLRPGIQSESLYASLKWAFARTAAVAAATAGALGIYNVMYYSGLGIAPSVLEALFGLPSATLLDALAYGAF